MAQVHVHVAQEPPKRGPVKRVVHWADRALLGVVMGVAAYMIERVVVRGSRNALEADADAAGPAARATSGRG